MHPAKFNLYWTGQKLIFFQRIFIGFLLSPIFLQGTLYLNPWFEVELFIKKICSSGQKKSDMSISETHRAVARLM